MSDDLTPTSTAIKKLFNKWNTQTNTKTGYLLSCDASGLDALYVDAELPSLLRPQAHHAESQTASIGFVQLSRTEISH